MDIRSKSNYIYIYLFKGAAIFWCTKKQPITTLSFYKVEYIAGTFAPCQTIFFNSLLNELEREVKKPLKIMVDNKSTINLTKNPTLHGEEVNILKSDFTL